MEASGELLRQAPQLGHVYARALPFHVGEYCHQWHFYIFEQRHLSALLHFLEQQRFEAQAGSCDCRHGLDGVEGRRCAVAGALIVVGAQAEICHCQGGEVVFLLGLAEVVGHRGIEPACALERHTQAPEYEHVALDVAAAERHRRR